MGEGGEGFFGGVATWRSSETRRCTWWNERWFCFVRLRNSWKALHFLKCLLIGTRLSVFTRGLLMGSTLLVILDTRLSWRWVKTCKNKQTVRKSGIYRRAENRHKIVRKSLLQLHKTSQWIILEVFLRTCMKLHRYVAKIEDFFRELVVAKVCIYEAMHLLFSSVCGL